MAFSIRAISIRKKHVCVHVHFAPYERLLFVQLPEPSLDEAHMVAWHMENKGGAYGLAAAKNAEQNNYQNSTQINPAHTF